MGDVLEFKRRPAFQQAAAPKPHPSSTDVGYHDFMSLRAAKLVLLYPNDSGDAYSLDNLFIDRSVLQRQGKDSPEMYLNDDDYIYYTLCKDEKPILYWDNLRQKKLTLRYDEDTFAPILRDARMQYMKRNFSVAPSSTL